MNPVRKLFYPTQGKKRRHPPKKTARLTRGLKKTRRGFKEGRRHR